MELDEIYREWRWSNYNLFNEIDMSILKNCISNPLMLNNGNLAQKYTPEILNNYRNKNYDVSPAQIEAYDKRLMEQYDHFFKMYSKPLSIPPNRSIFIENCYLIVDQYDIHELTEKIRTNLSYLLWWDILTIEQIIQTVIINHFLNSTQKLIGYHELEVYLNKKYLLKEDLVNCLLTNFEPSERSLGFMNTRGNLGFHYIWLFNNEFKRSIHIFENECRFDFNEKIIGCFYNEDLLFRELKRTFGLQTKVISQGSPEWLNSQRFDIYFPDFNIAVEYQGEQHFRPVDFGGKGMLIANKQFQDNIRRDAEKKEKAKINNCSLIFVNPNYDIKNVLDEIKREIEKKKKKYKIYLPCT